MIQDRLRHAVLRRSRGDRTGVGLAADCCSAAGARAGGRGSRACDGSCGRQTPPKSLAAAPAAAAPSRSTSPALFKAACASLSGPVVSVFLPPGNAPNRPCSALSIASPIPEASNSCLIDFSSSFVSSWRKIFCSAWPMLSLPSTAPMIAELSDPASSLSIFSARALSSAAALSLIAASLSWSAVPAPHGGSLSLAAVWSGRQRAAPSAPGSARPPQVRLDDLRLGRGRGIRR